MAISNLWRVRTAWTGLPGGPALTTTYIPFVGTSAQAAVDSLHAFWGATAAFIANDAAWTVQADVEQVDVLTGNITGVVSVTPRAGVGTAAGELLSLGTQLQLNLRTGVYVNGREVRGKLFLPTPTEQANNDGVPIATANTAMVNGYTALVAAAGQPAAVYSPTNLQWQPVTSAAPSTYFARLRSRQR